MIMAGHRHRSKRCIWHNRRHWRPATPNMNPDPWLSNAPPGSKRPQRWWAAPRPSLVHLYEAALGRDLSTADDIAAVLNWRLPEPTSTHGQAPLPWLPGIPQAINDHPDWRQYLDRRSQLIADLADHIRLTAATTALSPIGYRRAVL